jgi:hypothetical protein
MGLDISEPQGKQGTILVEYFTDIHKYSYASPDRLRRTSDALGKIRSVVSLFLKIIEQLEDTSEALITLVEFIDPITIILTDSLEYLRTHSTGRFSPFLLFLIYTCWS